MKTGKEISFWAFGMAMAILPPAGCGHSSCRSCTTVRMARKSTMNKFARILATVTSLLSGRTAGILGVIWLNRLGESILSREVSGRGFCENHECLSPAGRQSAAGRLCRTVPPRDNSGCSRDRAIVLTSNGVVEQDVRVGGAPGVHHDWGSGQLADGSLILGGDSPAVTGGSRKPSYAKFHHSGRVIYNYSHRGAKFASG